jgi:hypothetical protein
MTSATIVGVACGEDDVGCQYNRSGTVASAESFRELSLDLPAGGVPVDIEHDGPAIGELIHAEIDAGGRLHATAVIPNADWLLGYEGKVYYSPTLISVGPGVRSRRVAIADAAGLLALALTSSPATVGAQPVDIMHGDLRRSLDRANWPMSWRTEHPQLTRAVDALPANSFHAERHRAQRIEREHVVTPDAGPLLHRDAGYADEHGRLHGKDWWHGAPGQILSVAGYAVPTR